MMLREAILADLTCPRLTWRSRTILAFLRAEGGWLTAAQIDERFKLGRHTREILCEMTERGLVERRRADSTRTFYYRVPS